MFWNLKHHKRSNKVRPCKLSIRDELQDVLMQNKQAVIRPTFSATMTSAKQLAIKLSRLVFLVTTFCVYLFFTEFCFNVVISRISEQQYPWVIVDLPLEYLYAKAFILVPWKLGMNIKCLVHIKSKNLFHNKSNLYYK